MDAENRKISQKPVAHLSPTEAALHCRRRTIEKLGNGGDKTRDEGLELSALCDVQ
jgi:hypothetical protein